MTDPRIPPLPPDSPAVGAIGPIAAKGAKGINLMATMLQNPSVYEAWRPLARYLNSSETISLRDRELVILRTAWLTQSEYEWGNHALVVESSGVLEDQELLSIRLGSTAPTWTATEAALLRATEEFGSEGAISDSTWHILRESYSDAELVEIVVLVGFYWMLAYFARSLNIQPEGELISMFDYASLFVPSQRGTGSGAREIDRE